MWTVTFKLRFTVTAGVRQGSVVSPLMCVINNGVPVLPKADDVAVVVVLKQIKNVEVHANETVSAIKA